MKKTKFMIFKKSFVFLYAVFFSLFSSFAVSLGDVEVLVKMVKVNGGTFMMGSDSSDGEAEADEFPCHEVILPAFEIGMTEVTQDLYVLVMGKNPSKDDLGGKYPVDNLSFFDAIYFCNKLSKLFGYSPCYYVDGRSDVSKWKYVPHTKQLLSGELYCDFNADGFRLPTEAEWEYAARKKSDTLENSEVSSGPVGFKTLEKIVYETVVFSDLTTMAWYYDNARTSIHPVALLEPNGIGLYDMLGNVSEWCWDWYDDKYYSYSESIFPRGPETPPKNLMEDSGEGFKVFRGGDVYSELEILSYTYRAACKPHAADSATGFRLVRTSK